MNLYDFSVQKADGSYQPLADFQGQVVLIVNTASRCGFTKQYGGLEKLYEENKEKGFAVLAFPCNQFLRQEPGTNEEIQTFCRVNYGVTFPVYAKLDVRGKDQHPLYLYLTKGTGKEFKGAIKWNFTKFLIDREGNVVRRYSPTVTPAEMEADIKKFLEKPCS